MFRCPPSLPRGGGGRGGGWGGGLVRGRGRSWPRGTTVHSRGEALSHIGDIKEEEERREEEEEEGRRKKEEKVDTRFFDWLTVEYEGNEGGRFRMPLQGVMRASLRCCTT